MGVSAHSAMETPSFPPQHGVQECNRGSFYVVGGGVDFSLLSWCLLPSCLLQNTLRCLLVRFRS